MKVSVLILTNNEHQFWLKECITSALAIGDEIVIIDSGIEDTLFIEKWFDKDKRIKILRRSFNHPRDYTDSRNFGIENCTGDYILHLDADEVLADEAGMIIREIIESESNIDSFNLEGIHFINDLKIIDAALEHHFFLGRLHKNIPVMRYPKFTMHGVCGQNKLILVKQIPHPLIYHYGRIRDTKLILNKYYAEIKHSDIHKPEEVYKEIYNRLHKKITTKPFNKKHPSVLKLKEFGL